MTARSLALLLACGLAHAAAADAGPSAAHDAQPLAIAACPYPDDRERVLAVRQQAAARARALEMSSTAGALEQQAKEATPRNPDLQINLLRQALKLRVQGIGAMDGDTADHFKALADVIEQRVDTAHSQAMMAAMPKGVLDAARQAQDDAIHAMWEKMSREAVERVKHDLADKNNVIARAGVPPEALAEMQAQLPAQMEAVVASQMQARSKDEADRAAQPALAGDENQLLDEAAAMRDCAIRAYAALTFPTEAGAATHPEFAYYADNNREEEAQAYRQRGKIREAEHYLRDRYEGVGLFRLEASEMEAKRKEAAGALGENLRAQGRWAEAEVYLLQAGPSHSGSLADVLEKQRQYGDAEALRRGAEGSAGSDSAESNSVKLAKNLAAQGRYAEAAGLLRPIVARKAARATVVTDSPSTGLPQPPDPTVAAMRQSLGEWEAGAHQYEAAAADLETACDDERVQGWVVGPGRSFTMVSGPDGAQMTDAAGCYRQLLTTLWAAAEALPPRRDAYRNSAFKAAQDLLADRAGAALSDSAAHHVAASVGAAGVTARIDEKAGQLAGQAAKFDLAAITSRIMAKDGGASSPQDLAKLIEFAKTAGPGGTQMEGLSRELLARVPDYVDLLQPPSLDIRSLQAAPAPPEQRLLRDDEVLVQYLALGDAENGLVFVVTRDGSAWAHAGMSGKELDTTVAALRAEIDPHAYGVGTGGNKAPPMFEPAKAYALYHALFGDPAVERLFDDPRKTTLLLVPSGALTSFPPGLLVTKQPPAAESADPVSIAWLLRSKAVAVLPTVTALRTLRRVLPQRVKTAPDPLLVLADPDFGNAADERPCGEGETLGLLPPVELVERDGQADQPALFRELARNPLPCTRAEGLGLQKVLGGETLFGAAATESEIKRRSADGSLARERVLAFATHGLVTGDFRLAEPALALAVPPAGSDRDYDDGLLTASEVAGLKLNADWVILSACNTAAPDRPGAPGLSGLARAFFFAGARSLLVSQWTVNDAVAADLMSSTVVLQQQGESRARALQKSSLHILDHGHGNPAEWGVFTLIGDPS